MTKIKMLNDRIIFDGHADSRQECETITLMCDNLAQSKDFKTIRYESGYAEFEKVGKTEELKFVSAINDVTVVFDSHITKVENTYGSVTTSGNTLRTSDAINPETFNVTLENGYVIDTVVLDNGDAEAEGSLGSIGETSFTVYPGYGAIAGTITITSKIPAPKQTIDVSTLAGWANLATGNHQITIKTKASGYADSAASNAVTVNKKPEPTLQYYGTATELSALRRNLAATTIGNYALFGGGYYVDGSAIVDAYDTSLTRTIPTELSIARRDLAATTVGNYALFGGGASFVSNAISQKTTVDAYDTSLTRTITTELSVPRYKLAATTVGNYALFGGGEGLSSSPKKTVDAYDTSLTRTIPTELSVARYKLAATKVGNYALFGGGLPSNKTTADVYDTSLTRTIPTALSKGRGNLAATTVGNYALFGGGNNSAVVDAYDTSLTRTTPTELSVARLYLAATKVGNYALFGGGNNSAVVDAYNTRLTRIIPTELSQARGYLAATTVGNYALFGGGLTSTSQSNVVDAYIVE